jgi:hypothetical protein
MCKLLTVSKRHCIYVRISVQDGSDPNALYLGNEPLAQNGYEVGWVS